MDVSWFMCLNDGREIIIIVTYFRENMKENIKLGSNFHFSPSKQVINLGADEYTDLSNSESNILYVMIKNEGKICSHRQLEVEGWEGRPVSSSSLTVAIANLRKKVPSKGDVTLEIVNVPRKGYYLKIIKKPTLGHTVNKVTPNTNRNKNNCFYNKKNKSILPLSKKKAKLNAAIYMLNLIIFSLLVIGYGALNSLTKEVKCLEYGEKRLCSIEDIQLHHLDDIENGQTLFIHGKNKIVATHLNLKVIEL